jgi:hypothetical protein
MSEVPPVDVENEEIVSLRRMELQIRRDQLSFIQAFFRVSVRIILIIIVIAECDFLIVVVKDWAMARAGREEISRTVAAAVKDTLGSPGAVPVALTSSGARVLPSPQAALPALGYLWGRLPDVTPKRGLHASDLLLLLEPLVSAGQITHESASKLVDTLLDGAKQITVDAARQVIAKLLGESKKEIGVAATQQAIQICFAPTSTSIKDAGAAVGPPLKPPPEGGAAGPHKRKGAPPSKCPAFRGS